jgi:phosphotransferase system HPr-like phosphotransfer protein
VIVELAKIFHVTTDYLLGFEENRTISVQGLGDQELEAVAKMIDVLQRRK